MKKNYIQPATLLLNVAFEKSILNPASPDVNFASGSVNAASVGSRSGSNNWDDED